LSYNAKRFQSGENILGSDKAPEQSTAVSSRNGQQFHGSRMGWTVPQAMHPNNSRLWKSDYFLEQVRQNTPCGFE